MGQIVSTGVPQQRRTMDVKATAELIGVSTTTIYAMVREGQIPHIRVRSKILFHRDMVENWLREGQQASH
jgi:excisionase family DNA binding protein